MRLFLLFIFLTLTGLLTQAQTRKSFTHQQLYWVRYFEKVQLNDRWTMDAEIEDRRYFKQNTQHQWLLPRLQIAYKSSDALTWSLGGVYFLQSLPHDPEADSFSQNLEIRPHQMLTWKVNTGKGFWKHRYWLEERFFRNRDDEDNPWDFNFRMRYLIQYNHPIRNNTTGINVDGYVFNEVMLNIGQEVRVNVFDQNRIGAGIKVKWTPQFNTTLSYINWYQQRALPGSFFFRHILRLTLQHRFSLKK